jgi:hypothetical protein
VFFEPAEESDDLPLKLWPDYFGDKGKQGKTLLAVKPQAAWQQRARSVRVWDSYS